MKLESAVLVRSARWLAVWLTLAGAVPAAGGVAPSVEPPLACRPVEVPGLQVALAQLRRRDVPARPGSPVATSVAAREDFDRVAAAVLGLDRAADAPLLETVFDALRRGHALPVGCGRHILARDRAAGRLLAAGYSALEVADVLTGVLGQADVDRAYAMRMAGASAADAAAHLEAAAAARARQRAERAEAEAMKRRATGEPPAMRALSPALREAVGRLAQAHGLDANLVRAVIAAESGGESAAVSGAGAIGLMQLMPATARMLGVDPWDPFDNLRGGITYLSQLVREFGTVRDALIAYNAGPSHAERVQRGDAVLYGETRRYLDAIDRAYPLDR